MDHHILGVFQITLDNIWISLWANYYYIVIFTYILHNSIIIFCFFRWWIQLIQYYPYLKFKLLFKHEIDANKSKNILIYTYQVIKIKYSIWKGYTGKLSQKLLSDNEIDKILCNAYLEVHSHLSPLRYSFRKTYPWYA